jgi:hypothetical protein
MRSAKRCGKNRPAVVAAEKRTPMSLRFPPLSKVFDVSETP